MLPVGADEAWETVTELDEWLVEDADVELAPGAEGTLTLADGSERSVVVADVEPGSRLEWWWWAEDEPATHVSLTLTPAVSSTRVVVVESGRAAGPVCLALDGLLLVAA